MSFRRHHMARARHVSSRMVCDLENLDVCVVTLTDRHESLDRRARGSPVAADPRLSRGMKAGIASSIGTLPGRALLVILHYNPLRIENVVFHRFFRFRPVPVLDRIEYPFVGQESRSLRRPFGISFANSLRKRL